MATTKKITKRLNEREMNVQWTKMTIADACETVKADGSILLLILLLLQCTFYFSNDWDIPYLIQTEQIFLFGMLLYTL